MVITVSAEFPVQLMFDKVAAGDVDGATEYPPNDDACAAVPSKSAPECPLSKVDTTKALPLALGRVRRTHTKWRNDKHLKTV